MSESPRPRDASGRSRRWNADDPARLEIEIERIQKRIHVEDPPPEPLVAEQPPCEEIHRLALLHPVTPSHLERRTPQAQRHDMTHAPVGRDGGDERELGILVSV